ncbi:nickel-dependent hydrogenase large subunit [Methylotetracoccus oryzae]|uniref:nickel-dependent hydrogenase large subunit n=1 Tax=Methylotetracoccus oryzae TaxID=1919059 RepID=UPI00111A17F2|nr:nickel-dependent hydrogenase large subunit [Methylotetracoccus oryzae]
MNPGSVQLQVSWNGTQVTGADITNSRPEAAQLLRHRSPAEALVLVPLLFSICRHAQGTAAAAALASAEGLSAVTEDIAVGAEAAREHLWRLLLDWPKALGCEPDLATYSAWHRQLGDVAERRDWSTVGSDLKRFCEDRLLGMDTAAWLSSNGQSGLPAIYRERLPPCEAASVPPEEFSFLPTDMSARQYCAAIPTAEDAYHPTWQGRPAETGAYARWHALPPVARSRSPLVARMNARMADLAHLALEASGEASPFLRCDSHSPAFGSGFAVVETARGLLMHWVRLERRRIEDYRIVAPTEWNFHPAGAFAAGLTGLEAPDPAAIERHARLLALALDPCVPFTVEVRSA